MLGAAHLTHTAASCLPSWVQEEVHFPLQLWCWVQAALEGHHKHHVAPWEAQDRGAVIPSLLGCNSCPWLRRVRQTQKGGQCPTVPEMLCQKLTQLRKHLESSSKFAAWKGLCKPSCSVLNPRPGDSCTLSFLSCCP